MKLRSVYLAGGISGLSDAEANGWRAEAKRLLDPVATLDPMARDYRGREDQHVSEIVNGDLDDINRSWAVLANCPKPSWGTAMEIHYASTRLIPVVAVVPEGVQVISPWLRHHAHIVPSVASGAAYIRSLR